MLTPNWYPSEKQLRQFAVISLCGFGLLGFVARFGFGSHIAPYVLCLVGLLTFLVGMASPRAILPVYAAMMAIATPIGWLVSVVLLRILFYGVLTPLGVLFRLIGRDPLRLKRPEVKSYWLELDRQRNAASYYRQA